MQFEIRRVKNGVILNVRQSAEESSEAEEIVYQEKYEDEVECFAQFLRLLDEEYGPTTSRYSPKRIYIRVEPGDKYEPSEA
ncbi:MAG: hypothetical protein WC956_05450 [bacterium]